MTTLPDYLRSRLDIVSVGLNPSLPSIEAGFYFANPRNRFWRALNGSSLIGETLQPGPEAMDTLLDQWSIGFTDVVKRPTRNGSELRAADYRQWVPVLTDKLQRCAASFIWFHGMVAYRRFIAIIDQEVTEPVWGLQGHRLGPSRIYISPNPSPANAAYSLDVLIESYDELARLRDETAA